MALYTSIRFHPYSHEKRTLCLLPGSTLCAEIYHAKLIVYDLQASTPQIVQEHVFTEFGSFSEFCVVCDLEKGQIVVSGKAARGYVRYRLYALDNVKSYCIEFLKSPIAIDSIFVGDQTAPKVTFTNRERLFLGIDKAQDWPQVNRREDIREIVPFWYWLSQSMRCDQKFPTNVLEPGSLLFEANVNPSKESLTALFKAGFSGILVPRLTDCDFQGYHLPVTNEKNTSALGLLIQSFSLIRQLFFQEEKAVVRILPNLLAAFVSGTLTSLTTQKGHRLCIEWSKQTIRRLLVQAACDDELTFIFQKELKEYRLGKYQMNNGSKVSLRANQSYLFDNFKK